MRIGRWFVVGLWIFGVLSALAVASSPGLRALPVPSLIWPLIVALLVDLAVMPLAREGRVEPITMNERALGVIGAGLIHTVILMMLPA